LAIEGRRRQPPVDFCYGSIGYRPNLDRGALKGPMAANDLPLHEWSLLEHHLGYISLHERQDYVIDKKFCLSHLLMHERQVVLRGICERQNMLSLTFVDT